MSLIVIDGAPTMMMVGAVNQNGAALVSTFVSTLLDAANEACIMIGRVWTEDGASHTIDTTGSSALEWRSAAVTFANAGTTVKVGLADLDTAVGPPPRAINVADVITFDVSRSHTGGGGGITTTAWQTNVPSAGSKTIANGDLVAFAVQMTARAGADAVNISTLSGIATDARPTVTTFLGGAYAATSRIPNAVITFSDGVMGFFVGSYLASTTGSSQTWNNTSGTKEYGNIVSLPFPVRAYGIVAGISVSADLDLVLYSDPLGTPFAERTISIDLNTVGLAGNAQAREMFASPFDLAANASYCIAVKPSSASNVSASYITMNSASHQKSWQGGTNSYAVSRNTGAFAAQNSSKDRFAIGLLVGAFDNGAGVSGPAAQRLLVQHGSPY